MFFPSDLPYLPTEDYSQQIVINESENNLISPTDDLISQTGAGERFIPVQHFRDVEPTDWAYTAVKSLLERYQCVPAGANDLFDGDRAITRYEFAVILDACLEAIAPQLTDATFTEAEAQTTNTIEQLSLEFSSELARLSTEVNELEAIVTDLEANQFSKYTKMEGEVIFALSHAFGENFVERSENLSFLPGLSVDIDQSFIDQVNNQNRGIPSVNADIDNDQVTTFGYRARLDLNTSFTGDDNLLIRIAAAKLRPFTANSRGRFRAPAVRPLTSRPINERFTGNTGETFNTFQVVDSKLIYSFPIGSSRFHFAAAGASWYDFASVHNPHFFDEDGGNGTLSTLSSHSPIYRIGGGTGLAIHAPLAWKKEPHKGIDLTLGYLAGVDVSDPVSGFAKASYGIMAQTSFEAGDFDWGLTYLHAYNREDDGLFNRGFDDSEGFVGTRLANLPGSTLQQLTRSVVGLRPTGVVTNSYGFQGAWKVSDRLSLSGFVSYSDVKVLGQGDGELWTYGMGVAFPNLGQDNNLLGIFFGAQPYISTLDLPSLTYRNEFTPFHLEAFYRHELTDGITITPGFTWLMAPNGFDPDVLITSLRTTFSF